ncbi:hypothetical protein ACLQ2Q_22075 [Microbacterium sp. DT81.1]|uniref:hypothetical protein n=1 Tax=Microbacterium sp. DT81.1 TaxID=3393413 RepID=UPI003CFB19ED
MANLSAWRVNDVVAYEVMREVAGTLTAHLWNVARSGGERAVDARRELAQVRSELLAVDGYDRRAVDALTARLRARTPELPGDSS